MRLPPTAWAFHLAFYRGWIEACAEKISLDVATWVHGSAGTRAPPSTGLMRVMCHVAYGRYVTSLPPYTPRCRTCRVAQGRAQRQRPAASAARSFFALEVEPTERGHGTKR